MSGELEDEFRRVRPPRSDLSPEARARVRSRLDAAMAAEIESSARVGAAAVASDDASEPTPIAVTTLRVPDGDATTPPVRRRVPMVAVFVAAAALLVAFVVSRTTDEPDPIAVAGPSATATAPEEGTAPGGVAPPSVPPSEPSPASQQPTVHPIVAALVAETVTDGLPDDALVALDSLEPTATDVATARLEDGPLVVATVACAWADRWRAAAESGDDVAASEAADALAGLDRWPLVVALGGDELVRVVGATAERIVSAQRADDPASAPDHRPAICLDG